MVDSYLLLISECADMSLRKRLRTDDGRSQTLPVEVATDYTVGILHGLEHLHTRQPVILHRDLKPENVLLFGDVPRLADFGASRQMAGSHIGSEANRGTVEYSAPETFDGEYRVESDIWSVGVMLYEMVMGHRPFPQPRGPALMGAILKGSSEPLSTALPTGFREVIERCLEKDPRARFASAKAMREALCRPKIKDRNARDGAELIWIARGPFKMGDDDRNDNPRHVVDLSGYWMYRNLVTVGQYKRFCQATGQAMPAAPGFNSKRNGIPSL